MFRKTHPRGFSLLELLLALAILAILAGLGLPGLASQWRSHQVRAHALSLMYAVMSARGYAMANDVETVLCPGGADTLECAGTFTTGWMVKSREGEVVRVYSPRPGLRVLNRAGDQEVATELRWNSRGLGNRNLTLSVCTDTGSENWSLVVNRVGRPRLVRGWGTCPG